MLRRLLAAFATVLLAAGFVSADGSLWAGTKDCCAGAMCPMRQMMAGPHCDMDMGRPSAQFQSCPSPASLYGSAMVFVHTAPAELLNGEPIVERLALFVLPAVAPIELEVAAPPPRSSLS